MFAISWTSIFALPVLFHNWHTDDNGLGNIYRLATIVQQSNVIALFFDKIFPLKYCHNHSFAWAYSDIQIGSIVGRAASARLGYVANSVVEMATVRCHLVAEIFGWQFPVMDLCSQDEIDPILICDSDSLSFARFSYLGG